MCAKNEHVARVCAIPLEWSGNELFDCTTVETLQAGNGGVAATAKFQTSNAFVT